MTFRDHLGAAARKLADLVSDQPRPPAPTSAALTGGSGLGTHAAPERTAIDYRASKPMEIQGGGGTPSNRLAAPMASDSRAPRPGYGIIATGSRGDCAPPAGGMPGGELDASVQGSVKPTLTYGNR